MVKVCLDTSCFQEKGLQYLKRLMALREQGKLKLCQESISYSETNQWQSLLRDDHKELRELFYKIKPVSHASGVSKYVVESGEASIRHEEKQQGYTLAQLGKLHKKINEITGYLGIKPKNRSNQYGDNKMLAQHSLHGGDFFVTLDTKHFIKNKRNHEQLEVLCKIKIRELNEDLFSELDATLNLLRRPSKNFWWLPLTGLELLGLFFTLRYTIPFLIQVRDTGLASHGPQLYPVTLTGVSFIYVAYYIKSWKQLEFPFNIKNDFFSLMSEFIGRIIFLVVGAFVGIIYLQSWFPNWRESFSLIFIPAVLFALFLILKDLEKSSKSLSSSGK